MRNDPIALGQQIQHARGRQSVATVAKAARLKLTDLRAIEHGERLPDAFEAIRIAQALKTTVERLVDAARATPPRQAAQQP